MVNQLYQLYLLNIIFLSVVVCAKLLQSCLTLWYPMECSPQAPLSMGFSRKEYWSGLLFPLLEDFSGIKPTSVASTILADGFFTTSTTGKPVICQEITITFIKQY